MWILEKAKTCTTAQQRENTARIITIDLYNPQYLYSTFPTTTSEHKRFIINPIVHKVDSDLKKSLESADPWLANKLKQKAEPESDPKPDEEQ